MALFNSNDIELEEGIIAFLVLAFFGWLSIYMGMFGSADTAELISSTATVEAVQDLDSDSIPDSIDACPLVIGIADRQGCPEPKLEQDREELATEITTTTDVVAEKEPELVERSAPIAAAAVAASSTKIIDTDGDGVIDELDQCPQVTGSVKGCPADTDGDGFVDDEDRCPGTAGTVDGCPSDIDGDGLIDSADACPNEVGATDNSGCPEVEVTEEERAVIEEAVSSITFITGSATPTNYSKGLLSRVAVVMKRNPDYKLRISGHTDAVGDDDANLQLSKDRAEACYNFIIAEGVSPESLSHEGFGEYQPIGDNLNEEGRRANRRVEFDLHY